MNSSQPRTGELFSRQYIDRGPPTRESASFCHRLDVYLYKEISNGMAEVFRLVQLEIGVPSDINAYSLFKELHRREGMSAVLDAITLTYRYFDDKRHVSAAHAWHKFVTRALIEQNVGFKLDSQCGAHFLVDGEFEHNNASALRAADGPRYRAVRTEFEKAQAFLDGVSPDTKSAIRAMFEALEILAKLMVPTATRLTAELVTKQVTTLVHATTTDDTEKRALTKMMQSLGDFVDGAHFYRHGQATEEPIAPSLSLTVYMVSAGASALRLLLQADAHNETTKKL